MKKTITREHSTTAEIMRLFGISNKTLMQWKDKGCPQVAHGKWHGPDVIKWYIGYIGKAAPDEKTPALQESQARLFAANARLKEFELEREQGKWVLKSWMDEQNNDVCKVIMSQMLLIPRKISPQLLMVDKQRKIEKMLDEEIRNVLTFTGNLAGPSTGNYEQDAKLPDSPEYTTYRQQMAEYVDNFNKVLKDNIPEYERLMREQGQPIVPYEERMLKIEDYPLLST